MKSKGIKKISQLGLVTFVLGFSQLTLADEDFSKEVVKSTPLVQSIYMLEGAGGNITASFGADGTFLVDDDFFEMGEKLLSKIKELGGSTPRFIVNTHFHYDHTGGNRFFKSSTIIAAKEVKSRLSSEQILWKKKHPPVPDGLPNLTFNDRAMIYLNNEEIEVIHLKNGHTDGDTIVYFHKNKVISLGDLYFSGMYPIFHPEHQGSLRLYLKNIEYVLNLIPDGSIVVPGHGLLSNKNELANYALMIKESINMVKVGIKNKFTLEQIKKNGLDPKWEKYSHGYRNTDQWLTSIFDSCKRGDCP